MYVTYVSFWGIYEQKRGDATPHNAENNTTKSSYQAMQNIKNSRKAGQKGRKKNKP